MSERVPTGIRESVRLRANGRCEYCLIYEDDALLTHEHFSKDHGQIVGLTAVGRATVTLFQFNRPESVETRSHLVKTGRYLA